MPMPDLSKTTLTVNGATPKRAVKVVKVHLLEPDLLQRADDLVRANSAATPARDE